jgi:hypothetical protein
MHKLYLKKEYKLIELINLYLNNNQLFITKEIKVKQKESLLTQIIINLVMSIYNKVQ